MRNNELLLSIYRMNRTQGCLVFKSAGKLYKVVNLVNPLHFTGEMKLLSVAIDTGAEQDYPYPFNGTDGLARLLTCKFVQGVVALELWFKQQLRFSWKGTAKDFKTAVDRMIDRLPGFI